jgi:hypothetical protein
MTSSTRSVQSLDRCAAAAFAAALLCAPVSHADPGYRFFASPSGNIACQLGTFSDHGVARATVGCQIGQHDYASPPRPADCRGGWGDSVALTQGQPAALQCHTDTLLGSSSPVLDYGQTIIVEPIDCTSEESGMRCFDSRTGHGFSLSRDDYQLR